MRQKQAEQYRRARHAVREFVAGVETGDPERMVKAIGEDLDFGDVCGGGWKRVFRRVSKLPLVSNEIRDVFLRCYVYYGNHIRQETGNDIVLIAGLRMLLPSYRGSAMVLYRGQIAPPKGGRSYSISWTASHEVAEGFARGKRDMGGTVVLRTVAPPDAIICRVPAEEDRYGEDEYLVDRRRLHRVERLAAYEYVPRRALAK